MFWTQALYWLYVWQIPSPSLKLDFFLFNLSFDEYKFLILSVQFINIFLYKDFYIPSKNYFSALII